MASVAIPNGRALDRWRRWAPVAVLLGLCLVVGLINPSFFSIGNAVRMLNTAAIPLVVCMGATFIILMGSIDLSVEGVIALCAVAASMLVANDFTGIAIGLWSVPLAILLGGALGLVNGLIHVKLKIPSFMTTLGIGFAGIGIATAILGGVMVRIADNDFRNWLSLGRLFGIPAAVWIAGLAVFAAWVIQERTRIGRWLYAIGTDEQTARNSGIPVERTRILIFGIAGLFYGLAGALVRRADRPRPCPHLAGPAVHRHHRRGGRRHRPFRRRRLRSQLGHWRLHRHRTRQWHGADGH